MLSGSSSSSMSAGLGQQLSGTQPKQYAVFPYDKLAQMLNMQSRQQIATTAADDPSALDERIRSILADPHREFADDKSKVKALNQVYQKYFTVTRKLREPLAVPIVTAPGAVTAKEETASATADVPRYGIDITRVIRQVEELASSRNKTRARKLLFHLTDLSLPKQFGWNEKAELIVDGRTVSGSNVVTLIVDAVKQPSQSKFAIVPRGAAEFGRLLRRLNVTHELVRNFERYLLDPIEARRNRLQSAPATAATAKDFQRPAQKKMQQAAKAHATMASKHDRTIRGSSSTDDDDDDDSAFTLAAERPEAETLGDAGATGTQHQEEEDLPLATSSPKPGSSKGKGRRNDGGWLW
jgi:hypothetical protein